MKARCDGMLVKEGVSGEILEGVWGDRAGVACAGGKVRFCGNKKKKHISGELVKKLSVEGTTACGLSCGFGFGYHPAQSRGVCRDGGLSKYFLNSSLKQYQQIIAALPGLCLLSTHFSSVEVFLSIVRASPHWDRK